jgi:arsenate reductase-like glutaredoxin family protein
MILREGKNGISYMVNANTRESRKAIIVNSGMNLTGPVYVEGKKLYLGYNEEIICETEDDALNLLEEIDEILDKGN